ncbi:hypothetical protein WP50_16220 [Lactiplantibacillus plantarum]|nr:hypothetical protein WP50_16220 [Lactiplantibacillus plantarum]
MKQPIDIKTPYMTLGQLLKETAIIGSGGQAKWFLKETTVLVNGEPDDPSNGPFLQKRPFQF